MMKPFRLSFFYPTGRVLWALWLAALALPGGGARAQAPGFTQAAPLGAGPGGGQAAGEKLAADAQGNVYVTGSFSGTIDFGSTRLTSAAAGSRNGFVAKRGPTGSWLWAVRIGQSASDQGTDIVVDDNGYAYVAGTVSGPGTQFGSTTLPAGRLFVAKLDPAGNWLWAVSGGGNNVTSVNGLAVQPNGSAVAVTGSFYGSTTFGTTPALTSAGNDDAFVARLDGAGTWQWARSGGGSLTDKGLAVALDATGNTCLTGSFASSTATFGPTSLAQTPSPSLVIIGIPVIPTDVFVARLDAAGNWLWALGVGSNATDYSTGLALDSGGDAYVVGNYSGASITLGSTTLTSASNYSYNGGGYGSTAPGYELFVAKLSPAGTWFWATRAGLSSGGMGTGKVYMVGTDLALDASGSACVTGSMRGNFQDPASAYFGTTILPVAVGSVELFAARLTAGGTWQWVVKATSFVYGQGIASSGDGGTIYLAGTFSGASASFGPFTIANANNNSYTGYFAQLGGTVATGTTAARPASAVALWPNPARTSVQATGFAPGQPVQVLDAMGRVVLRVTVPANGPLLLPLPATLRPGIYLVWAPGQQSRLQVD